MKNPTCLRKRFHPVSYIFTLLLLLAALACSSLAVRAADTSQPADAAESGNSSGTEDHAVTEDP